MLDLPQLDPGIEISVASRGMSKGVAQSERPQLIVRPFVKLGDVQVGAQWKNVTSAVADGEAAVFVGFGRELASFQLTLQASHKFQTGVREQTDDHSWEFSGGLTRKLSRIMLRASAVYSPDDRRGKEIVLLGGRPRSGPQQAVQAVRQRRASLETARPRLHLVQRRRFNHRYPEHDARRPLVRY
jgi:hypothetical protein